MTASQLQTSLTLSTVPPLNQKMRFQDSTESSSIKWAQHSMFHLDDADRICSPLCHFLIKIRMMNNVLSLSSTCRYLLNNGFFVCIHLTMTIRVQLRCEIFR
jgi:hypothetical protein